MQWEEQQGKKPICSHSQKAFHIEPVQRAWTLPSVSAEDLPREIPLQPRSIIPQHPSISLDDLWLENTQRRRLKKQVQERKMQKRIAHKDGVQVNCSHAMCHQTWPGIPSSSAAACISCDSFLCYSLLPLGPLDTAQ